MKSTKYYLFLTFITLIFFLPFVLNPDSLITKNNDLARDYIPMFNFMHNTFRTYGQIPLWRSDQLMGETFVGNPLSSLFYPGNILFLVLPVKPGILIYLLSNFIMAAVFTFLLARSYRFSNQSSLATAIFYAFSTKMLVHLEAGHVTMLTAFAFFPLAFLAVRRLREKLSFSYLVIGSISLTLIYFSYPTVFYYSTVFLIVYWFYKSFPKITKVFPLVLLFLMTFGLSAIYLFPQLELGPLSTRDSLTLTDVAIPLWNLKKFLLSLFFPYFDLTKVNHEEFLYLGASPMILAAIGFLRLKVKQKIILGIVGIITILFVAGLSTPLFPLAYHYMPLLKYSRVTTRLWFVVALIAALLAGSALESLKNKKLTFLAVSVFLIEMAFIFQIRFKAVEPLLLENEELYKHLADSNGPYRVYCTTGCLNSQLTSKYKIQTLEGENPIGQKNFIRFLATAGNYKSDKFAVIFPPYEAWQTKNPPIPNAELLGEANVRFVASTYIVENPNFTKVGTYEDVYLYRNEKFLTRARFILSEDQRTTAFRPWESIETNETVTIKDYTPNKISLSFKSADFARTLIFSENYYPGWFAYIDNIKLNVSPHGVFRQIIVPANHEDLVLKFQPRSFILGKTITLATISFLVIYCFRRRSNKWQTLRS